MLDGTIFARHLDLTPLQGRRSGKVRCIFHEERTASLSVDLDALVFHCFGCGAEGGYTAFAVRVGEALPMVALAPLQEPTSWSVALEMAHRQKWADERVWRTYELADWVRQTRRAVAEVRCHATDDTPECWALLTRAAHLEAVANHVEAQLDA